MTTHTYTIERTEPRRYRDGAQSRRYLFKREDGSEVGVFALPDYAAAALLNTNEAQPDDELVFLFDGHEYERGTASELATLARWPQP